MEIFAQTLANFGDAGLWVNIAIGVIVGLVFGILPGVSGLTAAALLLPFVFKMSAMQALPIMIGIMSAQYIGGSITSILVNVPGDSPNAATLLDGYPMSRKGEAGRALGAAFTASTAAKFITVLCTLAMVPLVLPLVLAFKTADMVFLMLLGISFIAVLGAGSMVKGVISGGLGLLVSFIGPHPTTAVERFTFGSLYLHDGIPFLPVIIGIFALPEMVRLSMEADVRAATDTLFRGMKGVWQGVTDLIRHWRVGMVSVFIGYIIGVLPGIGGSSAAFVAYGQAKQMSKHRERFGTGTVEGVIAPESAIVSEQAGALLTTLALGIPGNAMGVVIIAAISLLGLPPGPAMITRHMDMTLTLILIFLVGGFIGALICFPLSPYLAKVATTPSNILVPMVLVITAVGLFGAEERIADVMVALVFGGIGLAMARFGYNRPAFVLGYILGGLFEKNFFIALSTDGPFFFVRPISLVLIAMTIAVISYEPVARAWRRRRS